MNRHNVQRLINLMEHGFNDVRYDQSCWLGKDPRHYLHTDKCETVACVGGHTVLLMEGDLRQEFIAKASKAMEFHDPTDPASRRFVPAVIGHLIQERARTFLGLEIKIANELFRSTLLNQDATPAQAVYVLKQLLRTGKVDWAEAMCSPPNDPPEEEGDEGEDEEDPIDEDAEDYDALQKVA